MCGIAGWITPNNKFKSELLDEIAHRGPDDQGHFEYENLILGHRRLSILDLSQAGHQPMSSHDNRYTIVFNGEIYNHIEIRKSLSFQDFKSTSDTETLLYGFIEKGGKILNLLNGIFAFAIFDRQTEELFIARDHFGVKPLYYYSNEESFFFASEIKAFSSHDAFKDQHDVKGLMNYLQFLWSPGEQTAFEKVKKLKPGHFLKLNINRPQNFSIEKYYQVPFTGKYFNDGESKLINQLQKRLEEAVKRQLLSDVPVGFFLSGGLDSSALVAMARKLLPDQKIQCFTIDTGELEQTEGFKGDLQYAIQVAKHLNVNLEIVKAEIDIMRDFDKMIWHLDEPQADAAPLNVLNICRRAKEMGYKVLIGGAGGDDLFSGYRRHQALKLDAFISAVPLFVRKPLKQLLANISVNSAAGRRIRKLNSGLDKPTEDRLINYFSWLDTKEVLHLFKPEIQQKLKDYKANGFFHERLSEVNHLDSLLNKMLYLEMNSFLVDHNLNYTDKMGMAEGVEIRVPFLDKDLVEFSTKIKPKLKLKGKETKYLLKKAMEDYLPKEVIYRPKTGFGAPVRKWITDDLNEYINQKLNKDSLEEMGIFNYESIQTLILKNKQGKIDASYTIFCILAIVSWYNQFIKKLEYEKSAD